MARYALVVGIAEYDAHQLQPLTKTLADAEAIAKLLEEYGYCNKVTRLIGKVTEEKFADALKKLLTQQAVNQEAIIYFTGHGIRGKTTPRDSFHKPPLQGFLTSSKTSLTKKGDDWIINGGAISFESINYLIGQKEFSSVTIIIDACYSGSLIQEIKQEFTKFKGKTNYSIIVSSQDYEVSWAKKSSDNSVFTEALLKALDKDQADEEGIITAGEAFEKVYKELKKERQEPERLVLGVPYPLLTYAITHKLMGYSPPSPLNQPVKNEPREAYLMVTVEEQKPNFLFKGYLGFKDDPESVTPLNIQQEAQEVTCILDEIPKYIRQYLIECNNDKQLKGKYHTLCVEIFLPFDYLTESVEHCQIQDDLGDLRELCQEKQVIIRSYERYKNNTFWNYLFKGWQRSQINTQAENIVQNILHLDQKETLNYNKLEIQLKEKSILTCTLTQKEKDIEILKAVIRSGIPLTFWSRSSEFDNKQEFEQKLTNYLQTNRYYNVIDLVTEIHKTRQESWVNSQNNQAPITEWGYHLGIWLDNPNRPPVSSLQSF